MVATILMIFLRINWPNFVQKYYTKIFGLSLWCHPLRMVSRAIGPATP